MKTRNFIFAALALIAATAACPKVRADAPTVVVNEVRETRSDKAFTVFNSLDIYLEITADEVAQAHSVMTITESALGESGKSLLKSGATMNWRDINRSFSTESVSGYIGLENPARADKTVREIAGRIEFYTPARDPKSVVTVSDIGARMGQNLENPILKAAGLEFIYLDRAHLDSYQKARKARAQIAPAPLSKVDQDIEDFLVGALNEEKTTLALISKNPGGRLVDIEIQTGEGEILKSRLASITPELLTYQYREKIPANARIVIYVATPQSVTKIPFQLMDVPLP